MCDATVLPHCGHLLSCGACQRFAALRVRNRIFDVLRFGTPMAGEHGSTSQEENNVICDSRIVIRIQRFTI